MIYDVVTYNGELDMLKLRLTLLEPYVDKFVIVEAKTTFSGRQKQLYFARHEPDFKKWWHKITYHIIDEDYSPEERELARLSPNTKGASHWQNEFLQKESIKKALAHLELKDTDLCFIGDVDEIWEWHAVELPRPTKLKLRVYAYYLNNRSDEQFWGTLVANYGMIKNECLNHLRTTTQGSRGYYGWHFTSMGGLSEVQRKLNDSYTAQSYNTDEVQLLLPERHKDGLDYLGRQFTFKLDDRDWPDYLKKHRELYYRLTK